MFDFEKCMREGLEQYNTLEREFDETIRALRARLGAAEPDASREAPMSLSPGTVLTARNSFVFRTDDDDTILVRQGDRFRVTSSRALQAKSGLVCVARLKQAAHYRYGFRPADFARFFRVEGCDTSLT